MKKYLITFLLCLFCIGCISQQTISPVTEQVSTHLPESTTSSLSIASEELTPLSPTSTSSPNTSVPSLTKGLPNGIKVTRQELPIRFETPLASLPKGNYIVFSTSNQPIYSDSKLPTIEFWAVSIDTYEKTLLFVCEKCSYRLNQYIDYRGEKIYLGFLESGCGETAIDPKNQMATLVKIDLSLMTPDSPYHFCTISPNFFWDLFQFHPVSPDGKWQIFGTASALVKFPNVPDMTHNLLLYSIESDEWLTLETGKSITSILWAPNGELFVEVASDDCGGKIGAYLVSLDDFAIHDLEPFLCNLDRISPRILGWLPDGKNIAVGWDIYNSNQDIFSVYLDQVSVCPAESIYTFDTGQCRVLTDSLNRDIMFSDLLWLSENGLFIGKWTSQGGEHISLLDLDGKIDYRGYMSNAYLSDISLELNKLLLITGKDRDILTYVDLNDVSKPSDFQIRVQNLHTAFWLIVP